VASFPLASEAAGFATPPALVLSVALALVGSAMVSHSVQDLALNRADLTRSTEEAALAGAEFEAAVDIVRSGVVGPYHWGFTDDAGVVDVAAELESDKLDPQSASTLDDKAFVAFGVQDPAALKSRLAAAAASGQPFLVSDLDAAPLWRACGPSFISPLGLQQSYVFAPRQKPGAGPNPASWHVGEAWRVRVASASGWTEDRIVRFTGDAQRPAAIVVREVSRSGTGWEPCETLMQELFAAD
jgi:hypothetical protein